jgi:CRISPR-associated protein Csd2
MAEHHLPRRIRELYECYDYRHALAILVGDFPGSFREVCDVLAEFRLTNEMIRKPGGNESEIPRVFSTQLRPRGWKEWELTAKVIIDEKEEVRSETHKIDYFKDKIAFDLEWNSKDQTFDRDLYAFRAFFEYNKISVGILVTRSSSLQAYFASLGNYVDRYGVERSIAAKYGASTTHMDKLLPRLEAGRSGGCPVLALGITTSLLVEVS